MLLASAACLPRLARRAITAAAGLGALLVAGCAASAQSTEGAMSASIMILAPVGSAQVKASPLTMSRAGVLSMETTSPVSGPTSQIVMVDVSEEGATAGALSRIAMRSGTSERALVTGRPVPLGATGIAPISGTSDDFRVSFVARVGTANADTAAVRLHVRYLAVAGT